MLLRRTPPKTPTCSESDAQSSTCIAIDQTGESTSNIPASESDKVHPRKRKYNGDCTAFMEEIRELLNSQKNQTDSKLRLIQTAMAEIKEQNIGIKNLLIFSPNNMTIW